MKKNTCLTEHLHTAIKALTLVSSTLFLIACDQNNLQSLNNLPEKPVQHISYLKPNQEAEGVLVKFLSNTGSNSRARSLQAAGLVENSRFRLVPGLTLANVESGLSINQALDNLSTDSSIAYAEPNYIISLDAIPNDPNFAMQYGLNNSNDADIDAPEAWDVTTGDSNIIIAVIDSGVDYTHPDLRSQMWRNPGEVAGNGRDDDGNGFVDDIYGWDFNTNDSDPMDEHNHGTHVSGIIGAQTNNSAGVAGVNWNVQIMALKFMNSQGQGTTSAAIRALDYAVANGARISNNSWGGGAFSQALFDAIQSANRQNHLFTAAAGNGDSAGVGINNDNTPHYPSSYNLPNIISVAATNQTDQLTGFSNFGVRSVDLAAPGSQIMSTIRNGAYRSFSGTSMASPYVAGVAGLVLAQNPNLSIAELKAAILDNVDPVSALASRVLTGGRLNAFNAVTSVSSSAPTTPVTPVTITQSSSTLSVTDSIQLSATGGNGVYTWSSSQPTIASINRSTGVLLARAAGSAQITVSDGNGLLSPAVNISVVAQQAANLTLSPSNLTQMALAANQQVTVTGGQAPYIWSSNNPAVASISSNAVNTQTANISANTSGSFRVSVMDTNGVSANSPIINVNAPALTLSAAKNTLQPAETLQLAVSGGTSPYSWSSSNRQVLNVDSGGQISAIAPGIATIKVLDIANAQKSLNIQVINNNTTGSLTVSPNNNIVSIGSRVRLRATGGSVDITWSTSNPGVASIDSRGIVLANKEGTVNIVAIDSQGNEGTATLEVRALAVTASNFTIGAGDTLQFAVNGGTAPYQWSVSNSSLANISANGLLTSSTGTVGGLLVTATDADNISKSVIITINNSTLTREPRAQ